MAYDIDGGDAAQAALRTKTLEVEVSPDVVGWVVETSGLEISSIAKRLRVSESTVLGWTKERQKISVAKLENLSEYVKRPLAVFLLDSPPDEQTPPDYRGGRAKITQKTALAIRLARYLQKAAGEMMGLLGEDSSPDIHGDATVRQSPEKAALEERPKLGLDELQATGSAGRARRIYDALRDSVEARNILVFQQRSRPDEMGCMSLCGRPCAILINAEGTAEAKIFALMHGYGHVLLGKGGLCLPDVRAERASSPTQNVEAWCSRFAAFALMPRTLLLEEYRALKESGKDGAETAALLARRFAVGKRAATTHARNLGLEVSDPRFGVEKAGRGADPGEPALACVSGRGRKFASLVLSARRAGAISGRDAVDYLGMDLKHIAELRASVR